MEKADPGVQMSRIQIRPHCIAPLNFEVDSFHSYFVSKFQVLVHNGCGHKRLSPGEIKKLQKANIDPHDLKPNSKYDLFKDSKGNVIVKPKNGAGPGDRTGININDL